MNEDEQVIWGQPVSFQDFVQGFQVTPNQRRVEFIPKADPQKFYVREKVASPSQDQGEIKDANKERVNRSLSNYASNNFLLSTSNIRPDQNGRYNPGLGQFAGDQTALTLSMGFDPFNGLGRYNFIKKIPKIIRNKGYVQVEPTPWNTVKLKWKGLGNNSFIELKQSEDWLSPVYMESTRPGTGKKLYDAAIKYAQDQNYKGVKSGENLLSAPKTYNIWKHYPDKVSIEGTGSHSNAKMVSGSPFYKEVKTVEELLQETAQGNRAYLEGPIYGLTKPNQNIYIKYLKHKCGGKIIERFKNRNKL